MFSLATRRECSSDWELRGRSFLGGGGFEPQLRITILPHSVLIFFPCPPTDGHFFGNLQTVIFLVTPPSKRDFIIIKPEMHIFCSVQRDFLFSVKLMTTHSKDVAASSVDFKNKLCLFAKTFLQKIHGIIFRSSGYGPPRACLCWPLNFFFLCVCEPPPLPG